MDKNASFRTSVIEHPLLQYPAFDELSNGLISLSELVEVVNAAHADLPLRARNRHKKFTASMASNYVKQKLTSPPVGKKYTRLHVCMILFAATIKLAYSAEDVIDITRRIFEGINEEGELQELQNILAYKFNVKTNDAVSVCSADAMPIIALDADTQELIELVTSVFAEKVRSLVLLSFMNELGN